MQVTRRMRAMEVRGILMLVCFQAIFPRTLNAMKTKMKPNIVLMITDDQDVELGSMEFMPKTLKLMRERGIEFKNAFVTTPICCPSRTTILSGLYVHNHNVFTNNANCSGVEWRETNEKSTFAVHLNNNGYRTGYFGKYLNEYAGTYVPPGWTEWMGLVKNSRFYNYSVNFNGKIRQHGFNYEKDYLTDLVVNESVRFVEKVIANTDQPFLVVLSFPAPHGPEDPAPQYSHLFENVDTHRTKSWNYAPNPDKQWLLQHTGKMEPAHIAFTDLLHRRRLQTLVSVDDAVHKVVNFLRLMNELHNTYLLFTSDHGYHLGQFGLVKGKNMPYEFDIKVPFFIRGPGLPRGKSVLEPVSNIDIAPTIIAMAGGEPVNIMDGRSILDLVLAKSDGDHLDKWRHTVLIERGKMTTRRRGSAAARSRLWALRNRYDKTLRLNRACSKPKFQQPCTVDQTWKCVKDDRTGRWRIQKCHVFERLEEADFVRKCFMNVSGAASVTNRRRRREDAAGMINQNEMAELLFGDVAKILENEFLLENELLRIVGENQWFQGVFEFSDANVTSRSRRRRKADTVDDVDSDFRDVETSTEDHEAYLKQQRMRINRRIRLLKRKLSGYKELKKAIRSGSGDASSSITSALHTRFDAQRFACVEHLLRRLDYDGEAVERINKHSLTSLQHRKPSDTGFNGAEVPMSCDVAQMNCFHHTATHWRTPPLWPPAFGEFCFCQNANNNTYWCLRTVNATHNFLYCEFITGTISFYDINTDPFQLHNKAYELDTSLVEQLSAQLQRLKTCRTAAECEHYGSAHWDTIRLSWKRR